MYPFVRLGWHLLCHGRGAPLGVTDEYVSRHICLPWDLDGALELNNGRALTLYDIGRLTAGFRMGLFGALRKRGWGLAVAGTSVRYRRRIRVFDRIEMRSRCVGWDARFVYVVQAMWVRGACCSQALLRTAVTSEAGIVPPAEVMAALGRAEASPALPDWAVAWIEAEAVRPWPPEDAPPAG